MDYAFSVPQYDALHGRAKFKWLLIASIVAIIGLLCIFIANYTELPGGSFINGIGQAALTTALVTWLYEFFSKTELIHLVEAKLRIKADLAESGIVAYGPTDYDEAFAYFDNATEVRLLSLDARTSFHEKRDVICEFLVRGGTSLTCLFAHPNEGIAPLVTKQRQAHRVPQSQRFHDTIEEIEAIVLDAKDKLGKQPDKPRVASTIMVRTYKDASYATIMFINDEICYYKPYFSFSRKLGIPMYWVRKTGRGLYEVCVAQFDFIRGRSEVSREWSV